MADELMQPDERSFRWRSRTVGIFGPRSASLLLTWLASHRGRLRLVLLGGHKLSVLILWDRKGTESCPERSDEEIEAMAVVAYGPPERDVAVTQSSEPLMNSRSVRRF